MIQHQVHQSVFLVRVATVVVPIFASLRTRPSPLRCNHGAIPHVLSSNFWRPVSSREEGLLGSEQRRVFRKERAQRRPQPKVERARHRRRRARARVAAAARVAPAQATMEPPGSARSLSCGRSRRHRSGRQQPSAVRAARSPGLGWTRRPAPRPARGRPALSCTRVARGPDSDPRLEAPPSHSGPRLARSEQGCAIGIRFSCRRITAGCTSPTAVPTTRAQ
jgi:hypothetical protein